MAETRIASGVASDLTNAMPEGTINTLNTDGTTGQETEYINNKWSTYFGKYKTVPELRAVIDAKSTWTVGKGFKKELDPETSKILDQIKGFGKDTFNTILENLIRTMHIGGDSFAERITDDDGELINLKPLDPGSIKIIVNPKGIIDRYEQMSKIDVKKPPKVFQPEDILHLARNRVADEIHGVSMVESLEWIIEAKDELQKIVRILMQRHVKPVMIFHLDTDNTTEIADFKRKMDAAYADGENFYIPKDVVVPEMLAVAPNATLNPLPWLEWLNNQFYQSSGVPQIVLGGVGAITEAAVKIAYLAFEQTIREEQLFVEEQVGMQLGIEIDLEFPASLENELISDQNKDAETGATQPNDTTAGSER